MIHGRVNIYANRKRQTWIALGQTVPAAVDNLRDDGIVVVRCDRHRDEGGCMAQITINEGLAWLKTLKKRHEELLALRNDNAHRERRFYGASAEKEIVKEPVYDVKVLDRLVTRVAREIRLLEQALKATNAERRPMPTTRTMLCWAS